MRCHVFAALAVNPDTPHEPVSLTRSRTGKFSRPYILHWQDGPGGDSLTVTLKGTDL